MANHGIVYLVGAGPGDPGLVTVKGLDCLRQADVVVYDRLANPDLLRQARPDAELVYVGKSAGRHALRQHEINELLVARASAGHRVVRLKGGDPFLFGRGGEEAEALAAAGLPFEVVPGVTSAIAVPAYAGIPVTHRDCTSTFAVVTGHEEPEAEVSDVDWAKLATGIGTIVFLMGVERLPRIAGQLVQHGRPRETPAAVIEWGTLPRQRVAVGTLADIVERVRAAGIEPPAVTVVGEVVRLRERLRWFDLGSRADESPALPDGTPVVAWEPLRGRRVLVTRSRDQASELSARLRELGAEPVEFPTIAIAPLADFTALDAALGRLDNYDWVVITSANGVRAVVDRLLAVGRDVRAFGRAKLAAIGPATAAELGQSGLRVDYVPKQFVAEAVAAGLPLAGSDRVLLLRADLAREALALELGRRGANVEEVAAYRTVVGAEDGSGLRQLLVGRAIDIVTFTSSSTVRNLARLLGSEGEPGSPARWLAGVTVACIGPITAETAREHGLTVDILAEEHTIPGLVRAIVRYLGQPAPGLEA